MVADLIIGRKVTPRKSMHKATSRDAKCREVSASWRNLGETPSSDPPACFALIIARPKLAHEGTPDTFGSLGGRNDYVASNDSQDLGLAPWLLELCLSDLRCPRRPHRAQRPPPKPPPNPARRASVRWSPSRQLEWRNNASHRRYRRWRQATSRPVSTLSEFSCRSPGTYSEATARGVARFNEKFRGYEYMENKTMNLKAWVEAQVRQAPRGDRVPAVCKKKSAAICISKRQSIVRYYKIRRLVTALDARFGGPETRPCGN